MILSLLKECKFQKVIDTQADGTGTTVGDTLDLGSADSVIGILALGDVDNTSVVTLQLFAGDESDMSDEAVLGTTATYTAAAADADDKLLVLDYIGLQKRYVRFKVVVATANAVIESVVSGIYNQRALPVTQSSDVIDGELGLGS